MKYNSDKQIIMKRETRDGLIRAARSAAGISLHRRCAAFFTQSGRLSPALLVIYAASGIPRIKSRIARYRFRSARRFSKSLR